MKRTLREIVEDMQALDDAIDQAGGEITGHEEEIAEFFAQNDEDLKTKVQGYVGLMRELDARAKRRKEEAKRIQALAKTDQKTADNLKERLRYYLDEIGVDKLETDLYKISIYNAGKAPLVVTDESKALQIYGELVPTMTADSKERMRNDAMTDDCHVAHFGERSRALRIK